MWKRAALIAGALCTAVVCGLVGTRHPAQASAPMSQYTIGTDTVTDTRTLLVWERAPSGRLQWKEALARCRALTLGGMTGWRLPTIKELQTIVDEAAATPPWLDQMAFPSAVPDMMDASASGEYWSSTPPFPPYEDDGWVVDFLNNGTIAQRVAMDPTPAAGSRPYSRCVR